MLDDKIIKLHSRESNPQSKSQKYQQETSIRKASPDPYLRRPNYKVENKANTIKPYLNLSTPKNKEEIKTNAFNPSPGLTGPKSKEETQPSAIKCTFAWWCNTKAAAWCRYENEILYFCDEHLGKHLINTPRKHNYQKLFDESNIETISDFLLFMQYKMQVLRDLKGKVIKEIIDEISKLENELERFIEKIDQEVADFALRINETTEELKSRSRYEKRFSLKLSLEATKFIKLSKKESISDIPFETIISEIYKNIGWVKHFEYQESPEQISDEEINQDVKTVNDEESSQDGESVNLFGYRSPQQSYHLQSIQNYQNQNNFTFAPKFG